MWPKIYYVSKCILSLLPDHDRNKAKYERSLYKSKIIYNWMLDLLNNHLIDIVFLYLI